MSITRRAKLYGAIFLAIFGVVALSALFLMTSRMLPWGATVTSPASMDAMVTMSTTPDKELILITCTPYHPSLMQRLFHSNLSCAFMVQHDAPMRSAVARSGRAHIEFQGDLLSVDFADESRFVFTTQSKGSYPPEEGYVSYVEGIGTYPSTGLASHAGFVSSRDWSARGRARSCGL